METTTRPTTGGHKRNASSKSNLLRAFVSSSKPNPRPETNNNSNNNNMQRSSKSVPFLPPDHPHAVAVKARVLGERQGNVQSPPTSPVKHNRGMKTEATRTTTQQVKVKTTDGSASNSSPKKSKSSTNLSAMFSRKNRSSKDLTALNTTTNTNTRDKENTTPPSSAGGTGQETPIWAQFAVAKPASRPGTRDSKASGKGEVEDEIARYTPREYSPSIQRNFDGEMGREGEMARPTLNSRPKSMYVSSSTTEGWAGALGRKVSGQRASIEGRMSGEARRDSGEPHRRVSGERPGLLKRSLTERKASGSSAELGPEKAKAGLSVLKRGGRVMAAVAAFQGKSKPATPTESQDSSLDPKALDEAFEAVLQSRQIPEAMRQKMRSLTLRVKADFIKQDLGSKTTSNSPEGSLSAGVAEGLRSPGAVKRDPPEDRRGRDEEEKATKRSRSRPRSRTFTFSKSDKRGGDTAPGKERSKSKTRPTSVYIPADGAATSATTSSKSPFASLGRNKPAATALPADYISHLRSQTDPTKLEVGRLHKLRILLRNETVAWVDSFLSLGGMVEIVGLLHRIMGLEWREEHEDQLFHETLLCLKGVCTTELAMVELGKCADSLFPALLGCLFDEEKKGPAEYATRTVIVNVLFNFLASATSGSAEALEERARRILGYLGEPQKAEEERPVGFVLDMRTPRPYRLWAREVTNVTREVFWIFLHHLNVVASPKRHNDDEMDGERVEVLEKSYMQRHFPGARPPVPAAPYIGGVEWDATTYITAHLDLLNGLLASLPTAEARNALREELRASGWEKTMGCTLRTCKEKFYSGVHDGLRVWVAAAWEDGWETGMVREGPTDEERADGYRARSKSPKKKVEGAPKIEALPELDLGLGGGGQEDKGWLE
ncbi:hypothetical protein LTS10_010355 [Elasticomyces elasticus]|nr:hypothetical protein LTS10_010355 [Elasticomyces elasticus]